MVEQQSYFAVVTPGLEFVSVAELEGLGAEGVELVAPGGVAFSGPPSLGLAVNLRARTVGRVLLRLGTFKASAFPALFKRVRAMDWAPYLVEGGAVEVKASARRSRLIHTGRIAGTVLDGIGARPAGPEEEPTTTVYARMEDDRCTLSVDLSGELLHKRGYREEVGRAPLRETMAAAILLASGYDGAEPLVNLACGTGSLAIEAALMASGRAPGLGRRFACEAWPLAAEAGWAQVRAEVEALTLAAPRGPIVATDRDAEAVAAAGRHAAAASCEGLIRFVVGDVGEAEVPAGAGLVVCNPPWGHRIGSVATLEGFYERLGASLARFVGWRAAILSTDKGLRARLEGALGRGPSQLRRYRQGGLEVTWTLYHIKGAAS